jgi:hypothetical protein
MKCYPIILYEIPLIFLSESVPFRLEMISRTYLLWKSSQALLTFLRFQFAFKLFTLIGRKKISIIPNLRLSLTQMRFRFQNFTSNGRLEVAKKGKLLPLLMIIREVKGFF